MKNTYSVYEKGNNNMKNTYSAYDVRKHPERKGWWVVDGERGFATYQTNTAEEARTLYKNGK